LSDKTNNRKRESQVSEARIRSLEGQLSAEKHHSAKLEDTAAKDQALLTVLTRHHIMHNMKPTSISSSSKPSKRSSDRENEAALHQLTLRRAKKRLKSGQSTKKH
jgi:hypothetical protein